MSKVLIVEDDKSLQEIYTANFAANGYETLVANDGIEALDIIAEKRPDLVVADVMMPRLSGFDMVDIVKSNHETKDTKFIIMTALSGDDQKEIGNKLKVDRYLVKSQTPAEQLVAQAQEVLGDVQPSSDSTKAESSSATI